MGGERYRREMRAALHELRQWLGEEIVPEAPQFLHRLYFLRSIMNAEK
jgi:hypothetical protein